MGKHFIGIDIGTSNICGVIYDLDSRKLKSVTYQNSAKVVVENVWEDVQEPKIILSIVSNIIDELTDEYKNIEAIGITGQMHGILYVDNSGEPVSPLYTWQDGRGNLPFDADLTYAEYISKMTGYNVSTGFGLVTHFYNDHNNLITKSASKLCTIMDFIAMNLAGLSIPVTDHTNAASLGLFDLEKLEFDIEGIQKLGINKDMLPEVVDAGKVIGNYSDNIKVCNALGDNQASFLGSVREIRESILVNIGTSSQVSVYTDQYEYIKDVDVRPFPGGGYIMVGSVLTGGYSLVVLKNFIEKLISAFCKSSQSEIDFYQFINQIKIDDDAIENSLNVDVSFRGTRLNPSKRGSIENISTANFSPENLIIGFANGICNESYGFYDMFPLEIRDRMNYLVGSGNAVRLNKILADLIERRYSHKLMIPLHLEEAAFGACISAMVGTNTIDDFYAAGEHLQYG
ncbi:sedoheptulokinase [Sunxiuqinia sp. A32]|uniref:sedoheptulokinase n=1 Tax=Sunxiuqinia sp. A32 TaxID=3461496 RepID=UPI00404578BE